MNKINEVFTMPVSVDEFIEIANNDEIGTREIRCIVHSLNHVDALAEALESIVTDYNQYRGLNGIDLTDDHSAKLDVKMAVSEAALAAYRGKA